MKDAQSPNRIIFASPHSGRIYPKAWIVQCKLSLKQLRQSEDAFVDEMFECAPKHGATLLKARFPRSFVDLNRAPDETPPHWSSRETLSTLRAQAGLGVIPLCVAEHVLIYDTPPTPVEGAARLSALYYPYHAALREHIDAARAHFGSAILIDCHSMPGFGALNRRRPDFILGDRFGKSCAPELINFIAEALMAMDYSVKRNHPYAGGYTTSHYGDPNEGVDALQIEINRDLYLNSVTLRPKPGFERLKQDIQTLIIKITDEYGCADIPLAAE